MYTFFFNYDSIYRYFNDNIDINFEITKYIDILVKKSISYRTRNCRYRPSLIDAQICIKILKHARIRVVFSMRKSDRIMFSKRYT